MFTRSIKTRCATAAVLACATALSLVAVAGASSGKKRELDPASPGQLGQATAAELSPGDAGSSFEDIKGMIAFRVRDQVERHAVASADARDEGLHNRLVVRGSTRNTGLMRVDPEMAAKMPAYWNVSAVDRLSAARMPDAAGRQ